MTEQNQREWPTFGDILTELNSLGQLSATLSGGSLTTDSSWAKQRAAEIMGSASSLSAGSTATTVTTGSGTAHSDTADDIVLPEELAPASFDTAALDETSPLVSTRTGEHDGTAVLDDLDTSALEPLEPLSEDIEPLPADFDLDLGVDLDTDTDAHVDEANVVDEDETTTADDPVGWTNPHGLFDAAVASPELWKDDVEVDHDTDEQDADPEQPGETAAIEMPEQGTKVGGVGAGLDPITGEIDWSQTDWADDGTDPTAALDQPLVWSDAGSAEQDPSESEPRGGIVFPFTSLGSTGGSRTDIDEDDVAPQTTEEASSNFDSVATADAIENDLQDLFELDQVREDNDNVVPLHPSSDDHSDAVVGLDTAFDHDTDHEPLQEWVGIDPAEIGPKDPWAHMRPDDEETKSGFWANRPKFFGGDERKAKKKARQSTVEATDPTAGGTDSLAPAKNRFPCPACHEAGQVDLEDPVADKMHLSCASCGQVWTQPMDARNDQKSA